DRRRGAGDARGTAARPDRPAADQGEERGGAAGLGGRGQGRPAGGGGGRRGRPRPGGRQTGGGGGEGGGRQGGRAQGHGPGRRQRSEQAGRGAGDGSQTVAGEAGVRRAPRNSAGSWGRSSWRAMGPEWVDSGQVHRRGSRSTEGRHEHPV